MRWEGRRQSSNVEDRRSEPPLAGRTGRGTGFRVPVGRSGGGGLGIGGILAIVVVFLVLRAVGIDPMDALNDQGNVTQPGGATTEASDKQAQFAATILAETEDVWNGIFKANGATYTEPSMVLYTDSDRSACGFASSAAGPFYCPSDQKIYLDLSFFDELANRFGAAGDFARAYVIAHEVGHHVQNLTGVLPAYHQKISHMNEADRNAMSVRVELQADCYAGVWAHYTDQKGLLEDGDIEEALTAAQQIGDDTLQRETQGYVVPDSFTHGSSKQRMKWFSRGLSQGRVKDCDTFSGDI